MGDAEFLVQHADRVFEGVAVGYLDAGEESGGKEVSISIRTINPVSSDYR